MRRRGRLVCGAEGSRARSQPRRGGRGARRSDRFGASRGARRALRHATAASVVSTRSAAAARRPEAHLLAAASRSRSTSPSRTSPRMRAIQPSSSRSPWRRSPVEERAKRAQVGTQPTCRDACLMDAFRIDVDPDDGVVQDQADHGERDRALHDVACRRVGPEVGDGDLGRQRAGRRERADVLRGLVGRPRAGKPQPFDERVEERRGHLVADLDFELAERGRAAAVDHRNGVVDDAGDEPPVRVVQSGSASDRRHADALVDVP